MIVRPCRRIRIAFVTLALFAFPLGTVTAKPAQSEWDFYDTLLKMKLPIERKMGMYVGYRYSHAPVPGDLEYSFTVAYNTIGDIAGSEQPISAEVHVAESTSIYEQLSALRRKNPKEDTLSVMNKLKVRSFYLTEQQCPAVRGQFEKFKKLEFAPPRFDFISLDAPNHEFRIISSTGHMTFESLDEGYPLVQWALETRRALDSCISGGSASNAPKN